MPLTIKTTGIEDYLDGGEAYVKALVAGLPSAGKTRSASFWPKPIFADCEKGRMSIADRKMPYGEVTSISDMKDLMRMLKLECMKPVASRKYQTLVIDTIDAYQRIVIQERLNSERKEAFEGYKDWGFLDAQMTWLISQLIALPMNIVVNMHVKEHKEGEDGPVTVQPKLKGDIREQIAAEFDLVGFMGTSYVAVQGERTLKRQLQWHPDPRTPWLKDRSGRLPRFTDVTFTEDDYSGLFLPLSAALDDLTASEELETLPTEENTATPVPPHTTGAVATPDPAPAKRAAAKKAAPAAAGPAVSPPPAGPAATPAKAVPPARRPVREVVDANVPDAGAEAAPGATEPVEGGAVDGDGVMDTQPAATDEEAVALVESALGGVVTHEIVPPEEDDTPMALASSTPAAESTTSVPATPVRTCGTPGKMGGALTDNPVPGCGKDLSTEKSDLVNIALIKTTREKRPTYLCPACLAAHKASA